MRSRLRFSVRLVFGPKLVDTMLTVQQEGFHRWIRSLAIATSLLRAQLTALFSSWLDGRTQASLKRKSADLVMPGTYA